MLSVSEPLEATEPSYRRLNYQSRREGGRHVWWNDEGASRRDAHTILAVAGPGAIWYPRARVNP